MKVDEREKYKLIDVFSFLFSQSKEIEKSWIYYEVDEKRDFWWMIRMYKEDIVLSNDSSPSLLPQNVKVGLFYSKTVIIA